MLSRDQLIKFIPKPKNEDVIIYNTELKDLIDINVFEEYEKDIYNFLNKKREYLLIKEKIKEVEDFINNMYLYNPSWTKEDYLIKLKNDKKTYSILFDEIRKKENNIDILQKKLRVMNEKIEMQEQKENKEIKKRKDNIDNDIEKDKNSLLTLKEKLSFYQLQLEILESDIAKNQEEFNDLVETEEELKIGKCKCKLCGSLIKVYSENSLIFKRLMKNLTENKKQLEKLLNKKESVDKEIAFYESEISKIKIRLHNNIQFKKENNNFYTKKSLEILKLEALRDEIVNNISKLEEELKTKPQKKSNDYIDLKNRIEKYELSLENLKKSNELRQNINNDIQNYKILKTELKNLYDLLKKYKEFISIYYKICEKKANEYFGNEFKFKLFQFDDVVLKECFEIKYNDIEYSQLDENLKEKVDQIFAEKISIFY